MKKITVCLILALIFLLCSLTVCAGDIHEEFIRNEQALIFFGKVTTYQSDKDCFRIAVSPVAEIKGNTPKNTMLTFDNPYCCGDFKPKKDKIYLIGYLDERNVYVFDVTTYDTQTAEIKHAKGVWIAFQQYLNEGKYGTVKLAYEIPDTKPSFAVFCIVGGAFCVFLFGIITVCKRKRFHTT